MLATGLIDHMPHMVAGQADGCSPIVDAFEAGENTVQRVPTPSTIAHAIENPFPPSGNQVLRKLREHRGTAVTVTDSEILEAQGVLAREGIFGQPAAAVPLAVVRRLLTSNAIAESDTVVCVVTGGGLKYTAALDQHPLTVGSTTLEAMESVLQG
jgi:threonine synthase